MIKKSRNKSKRISKYRRYKRRNIKNKKTRKYYGGYRFTVEEEQNPSSYNDVTEISQSNFTRLNLD